MLASERTFLDGQRALLFFSKACCVWFGSRPKPRGKPLLALKSLRKQPYLDLENISLAPEEISKLVSAWCK